MKPSFYRLGARLLVGLLVITVLLSLAKPSQAATTITAAFGSFNSTNIQAFQVNGNAALSGSSVRLTPELGDQMGSIFWKTRLNLDAYYHFSAAFSFHMVNNTNSPADGITFCLQTVSNDSGSFGGGLGYDGIDPSFAVEFDTWKNAESGDPNANHVGIDMSGSVVSLQTANPSYTLSDGSIYYAWVDYDGTTMEVRLSDTNTRPGSALLSRAVNLPAEFNNGDVFVGFTAATGGSDEEHWIDSFYFNNAYTPLDPKNTTYDTGPLTVTLSTGDSTLYAGQSATLTAHVTDINGAAMNGQTVTFYSPYGSLSSTTASSNASGDAYVTLTNNNVGASGFTLRASAVGGALGTTSQTMYANQTPSAVSLSNTTVPENQTVTSVGTVSASDPDPGQTASISLGCSGTDNSSFYLSGGSLYSNISLFDYESKSSYQICLRSTDDFGATRDQGYTISVADSNDAPVMSPATPNLVTIDEDNTTNSGQTVASFLGSTVSDQDASAVEGVAIYSIAAGNSYFEYSTNGGASWSSMGSVSSASALLLRATDRVRYMPDAMNGTTASFSYYAWDQTSGGPGPGVNVTSRGTPTAFSSMSDTAMITVTSVNDAPVLTAVAPNMPTLNEADLTNTGVLISSIVGANQSDVDTGAVKGIAVTAVVDSVNGVWQYTTDGSTWNNIGPVAVNSARLVASDANNRIRYLPHLIYHGQLTNGLTFRAWDQTAGSDGGLGNTTSNGLTTAYSTTTDNYSITVLPNNINHPNTCTAVATGTWGLVTTWQTCMPATGDTVIVDPGIVLTMEIDPWVGMVGPTTIPNSSVLAMNGARDIKNNSFLVNGTFRITTGSSATNATIAYGPNGTLEFSNTGSAYTLPASPVYWPTSSGPYNVTVNASGGLDMTSRVRTVNGLFQTASAVSNCGSLTITNTLKVNQGGSFSCAPTYSAGAILEYSTSNTFGPTTEWSSTSGAGYPANVHLINNTTLDLGASGTGTARKISEDMTIDPGSTLTLNGAGHPMTAALTILGDTINNGSLLLSTSAGGDLNLDGDFDNSGTFNAQTRTVTFTGTGTITGSTTTQFYHLVSAGGAALTSHAAEIRVSGDFTKTGGFAHNNGLVTFNGSGLQTVSGSPTFYDLTVNNTAGSPADGVSVTTPAGQPVTSDNNLVIQDGEFYPASGSIFKNVAIQAAGILKPQSPGALNVSGNWADNGSFLHNSGTVTFNGTSTLSGSSTTQFHHVVIAPASTLIGHTANVNVDGDFTNNDTFTHNSGKFTFNGSGLQTISGSPVFYDLTVNNSAVSPADGISVTTPSNQIVTSTNNLVVQDGEFYPASGSIFKNVTIQTNGIFKPQSPGALNVSGNWADSGSFLHNSGTVTFDGSSTLSGSSTTQFHHVVIAPTSTLIGHATNVNVDGDFTNNGSFTHNSGKFTFNGSGLQTISGSPVFYDLTVNNTAGSPADGISVTTLPGQILTSTNNLVVQDGEFYPASGSIFKNVNIQTNGIFKPQSPGALNVSGSWVDSGSFLHNSGTVTFDGTSTLSGSSTTQFHHVVISSTLTGHATQANVDGNWTNNGTFNSNSGIVHFNGTSLISGSSTTRFHTVEIQSGASLTAHSTETQSTGNLVVQGSFLNNSGLFTFNGSGLQTISGSPVFYDLTVNNSAGSPADGISVTTPANQIVTSTNNLVVQDGEFYPASGSIFKNVSIQTNGIFKPQTPGALNVSGNWADSGSFLHNSGTVTFDGTSTLSGSSTTQFHHVVIASLSALTGHVTNANVDGDFTNNGIFTHNSGKFTFNGSGLQTISGSPVFYDLTVNNSAGSPADGISVTTPSNQIVTSTNNLVVQDGEFYPASGSIFKNVSIQAVGILKPQTPGALNVSGNWADSGSFLHNSGTVTFDGTSALSGSSTTQFHHVVIAPASTLTGHANNANVDGDFTLSGGFTHNNGKFTFNGSVLQTITGSPTFFDLTINNSAAVPSDGISVTTPSGQPLTSQNNLLVQDGEFYPASGSIFKNVSIQSGQTFKPQTPGALNVSGNWVDNGFFLHNNGLVTFDGTSTLSGSSTSQFHNLVIAPSSTLTGHATQANVDADWTNNGTFNSNTGVVHFNGVSQILGNSTTRFHTVEIQSGASLTAHPTETQATGNLAVQGSFINNSSLFTFNGSAAQTISGSPTFYDLKVNNWAASPSDSISVSMPSNQPVISQNNLTVLDGEFYPASSSVFKNVSIQSNGILKPQSPGALDVSGNWADDGSFLHNSGTVTFNGVTTMSGASSTRFYNVVLPGGATLNGHPVEMRVDGDFTRTGTFNHNSGGVNFTGSAKQLITGSPTFYNLLVNNTAALPSDAISVTTPPTGILTVANLLHVSSGEFYPASCSTFHSITLDGTGIFKLQPPACANVSGDWTKNGGTFVPTGTTLTFTGPGTQTIGGTQPTTFENVIVNGSAPLRGTQPSTITGVLTVTNGTYEPTGGTDINEVYIQTNGTFIPKGGVTDVHEWSNFGTVDVTQGGTINADVMLTVYVDDNYDTDTKGWGFDHFAGLQNGENAISPSGTVIVFSGGYDESLTLNKASTVTMLGNVTINGSLNLQAGALVAPTGFLTLTGDFNHTGGEFNANGGTVVLTGTDQSINGSSTFNNLTKQSAVSDTLTFSSGDTQIISGTLLLQGGGPSALLHLKPSTTGVHWRIEPRSSTDVRYVNVEDSVNNSLIFIYAAQSVGTGVNVRWNVKAPTGSGDTYATLEDENLTVLPAYGVLANDSDVDFNPVFAQVVANPSHGVVEFHSDGSFSYIPDKDFYGDDTFTYNAFDANLSKGPILVTITVIAVNDAPVANAGQDRFADEGVALTIQGSFIDVDQIGSPIVEWDFGDGTTGSGVLTPSHTYQQQGTYFPVLTVTDDHGAVSKSTARVTVSNVAPTVTHFAQGWSQVGVPTRFTLEFTDSGVLDKHIVNVVWEQGVLQKYEVEAGVYTLDLNHAFKNPGQNTVMVMVEDEDGGQDTYAFIYNTKIHLSFPLILP
jgi:formylmethanofuran dehydrogenase subunit C